ncbi:MAG: hypothetical protein V3U87_15115 [Methylococcaceae bacterium]
MKHLYKKTMMIALMMVTITVAHASDAFSHTVLLLLDNPQNKETWSQTITSQEEWETFYYAPLMYMSPVVGSGYERPIAPKFDFEKYQILTGGLGVKFAENLGAEHTLSVEKVIEEENEIVVFVLSISPDLNCLSSSDEIDGFPSYPTATVLVKKTDKPFKIKVSKLIETECP